jgi:hypothetical protein
MSMHYFSWSGGTGTDLTKSTLWQTRHTKLVFSASGGSAGHICFLKLSGHEMSTHYFSCSGGPGAFSQRKHVGTHYAKVVFCNRWDLRVT